MRNRGGGSPPVCGGVEAITRVKRSKEEIGVCAFCDENKDRIVDEATVLSLSSMTVVDIVDGIQGGSLWRMPDSDAEAER